jgi:predicted O-methyltransferase YrrM
MAQFLRGAQRRSPELLDFVNSVLAREDDVLRRVREDTPKKGLPPISIGPEEGKLLDMLAKSVGARKIVEVGTLAGYSAIWLARALPAGGLLHTIEFDPKHAAVARENIAAAGLSKKAFVHQGAGLDVLPKLSKEGPFDLCFIDADKANYANYGKWAAANVRSGGLVVGDNAYLFGKLHLEPAQAGEDAPGVPGMRGFLSLLADPELFSSCAMMPTGEGMAVGVRK